MDRTSNHNRQHYKFALGIYAVVASLSGTPVFAQAAPSNTNIAGPSASATGNVTNQAVQVLQGPFAINSYGSGVKCQGLTFNIAPFLMGSRNYNWDPESYLTGSGNMGISASFQVPLDQESMRLCKERARTEITRQQAEADKARLDFELVRLLKCGEAMKQGVRFHPQSPYAKICADVIVINPKPKPVVAVDPNLNTGESQKK